MSEFDEYMDDVYNQLEEHASEDHKSQHITFTFSTKLVNNNLDYFERCMDRGLSAYKALTFFGYYLNEDSDL